MNDYLAQSVRKFEERRVRSARNDFLVSLAILALWIITAVVLAQRGAEPWSWVVISLILFGTTVRLVLTFLDWKKLRKNPHLPPIG